MPEVFRQRRQRTRSGLDRGSLLDESAVWSRHRYVAQESIREPCDCGMPCAMENRHLMGNYIA